MSHGQSNAAADCRFVTLIPLPDHFECAATSSLLSKYHSPGTDSIQTDLGSVLVNFAMHQKAGADTVVITRQ